jgi:hypothetical protein
VAQLAVAAHEKRRAGEERDRERSLRNDQGAASASAKSADDDSATSRVQGGESVHPGSGKGGQYAEQQTGRDDRQRAESQRSGRQFHRHLERQNNAGCFHENVDEPRG